MRPNTYNFCGLSAFKPLSGATPSKCRCLLLR